MSSQEDLTPQEVANEGQALALKLELLATVAQATMTAILRVVDERRSGELNAEQIEKVADVRVHVEKALKAVDDYAQSHEDDEDAIDLTGLRDRLAKIVLELDERVPAFDVEPS